VEYRRIYVALHGWEDVIGDQTSEGASVLVLLRQQGSLAVAHG